MTTVRVILDDHIWEFEARDNLDIEEYQKMVEVLGFHAHGLKLEIED